MQVDISDEARLEDLLATPLQVNIDAMRELQGNILILGVGGKMGPSLARRALHACDAAGVRKRVIAVARFSDARLPSMLESVVSRRLRAIFWRGCPRSLAGLRQRDLHGRPKVSAGPPGRAHRPFANRCILNRECIPAQPCGARGSVETAAVAPVGEYAQCALGRERMFEHFSALHGTPVTLFRLNYAINLPYGILLDIAQKVWHGEPVNVTMPSVNVIRQGDANSICLRSFSLAASPPVKLNVTGPETASVRWLAHEFASRLGTGVSIEGVEAPTALLSNAAMCYRQLGYPSIALHQMIDWVANWVRICGVTLGRPNRFAQREGAF